MRRRIERRTVLRTAAAVGALALAGCGDDGSPGTQGSEAPDGDAETSTESRSDPSTGGTVGGATDSVDAFLAETSNYDGIHDGTGRDAVAVDVGVEGNGAYFAFGPAAVRIDRETTVTWTWTGQGGIHNVAAVEGADFASAQRAEEGATFRRQFDDPSTVLYECLPHSGTGMKGAIVVE